MNTESFDGARHGWLRAQRITRLEQARLGRLRLNQSLLTNLSHEGVGLLVENCGRLEQVVSHLKDLDSTSQEVSWVVVLASDAMSEVVCRMWGGEVPSRKRRASVPPWHSGSMTFVTPEALASLLETEAYRGDGKKPVAGILLIDMLCHVHKYRGHKRFYHARMDRPGLVSQFQAAMKSRGFVAPLILFTASLAKSVETNSVLRAYSLASLWFLDGRSLSCRPVVPTPPDQPGREVIEPLTPSLAC